MVTNSKFEGASVVVIGNFNPAIFHPMWFEKCELIAAEDAKAAEEIVVTSDFASFTLQWCRIQVFSDRFSVETTDPAKVIELQDLVAGTFAMLEHCPVKSFGLNRFYHVQLESEEEWHKIGHLLAPKSVWDGVIPNSGTRTVCIWGESTEGKGTHGRIQARFEPSKRLNYGVFFEINRHYTIVVQQNEIDGNIQSNDEGTDVLLQNLPGNWATFLTESENVVTHVLTKSKELISNG